MSDRLYEITFIMPTSINEAEQKEVEERILGWITESGGQVTNNSHWGRRRLAYQIGQNREGYYILLEAELPGEAVVEIQRRMNLDANVLRYLVVKVDE